jgi:hypothetical protein
MGKEKHILPPPKPLPKWWPVTAYTDGARVIVCGIPNDTDGDVDHPDAHNCDAMGCSSIEHVIVRFTLPQPMPRPPRPWWECPRCEGKVSKNSRDQRQCFACGWDEGIHGYDAPPAEGTR